MKNIKFLALLPVLMLSACGLGTKLNEDQAKERKDAINDKLADMAEDDNYKNSKMSIVIDSFNLDKDGNKTKVKQTFKIESNQDGETHAYAEFVAGSEKQYHDFYLVNYDDSETEEDQIIYAKTYDSEAEDEKEVVICVSKGASSTEFSYAMQAFAAEAAVPLAAIAAYANPETVVASFENEASDDYDVDISYYSGINGDFSIKCVANLSGDVEVPEDQEDLYTKQSNCIVTYSKDVLSSFDSSSKMVSGETTSIRGSVAYQKSKIKISLPNGWKDKLDAKEEAE